MPIYSGKTTATELRGGKNILASEHLQFIEAGGTLDGSEFETGIVESGKLVCRDLETGKFVPYDETAEGDFDNYAITNVDFENDGESDYIIGELIVRGSVYEQKLADEVPTSFKEANPLIRYVSHK